MRSKSIIKTLDSAGCMGIPGNLRKSAKIDKGDALKNFIDSEKIILAKYKSNSKCIVTGETSENDFKLRSGGIVISTEGARDLLCKINNVIPF